VGGALRCTIPLLPWAVGLWARYDGAVHELSEWNLVEPFVGALAIGALGSYRLLDEPVRLDIGLTGSLVLVHMSGEVPASTEAGEIEADKSSLDGRLGSELRLAVPLSPSWHAVAVLDAEVAPGAAIDSEARVLHEVLPPMPAYTIGVSVGAEVSVP